MRVVGSASSLEVLRVTGSTRFVRFNQLTP
jgi:hypothetical protein